MTFLLLLLLINVTKLPFVNFCVYLKFELVFVKYQRDWWWVSVKRSAHTGS